MKLIRHQGNDFGPLRGAFSLPLDDLGDAKVIAIHGKNGVGKTSLIELVPAGFTRSLAGRGKPDERPPTLAAFARKGEKSSLEQTWEFDNGDVAHIEHIVNAARATPSAEAYLRVNGVPKCDGGMNDFDAAVAKLFPSPSVYLLSAWGARRNRGAFLAVSSAQRAGTIGTMLGLERMMRMSTGAGSRAEKARTELKLREAALVGLRAMAAQAAGLREEIDSADDAVLEAELAVAHARDQVEQRAASERLVAEERARLAESLAERRRGVTAAQQAAERAREQHKAAVQAHQAAASRVADLETRLAREPELRAAVERGEQAKRQGEARAAADAAARAQRTDIEGSLQAARRDQDEAVKAADATREAYAEATKALGVAQARKESLEARVVRASALRPVVEAGELARAEVARLEAEQEAEQAVAAARRLARVEWSADVGVADAAALEARRARDGWLADQARAVATAEKELAGLKAAAARLGRVPCGGETLFGYLDPHGRDESPDKPIDCGTCELLGDAREAQRRIPEAEDRLRILQAEQPPAELEQRAEETSAALQSLMESPPPKVKLDPVADHARALALHQARLDVTAGERAAGELASVAQVEADLELARQEEAVARGTSAARAVQLDEAAKVAAVAKATLASKEQGALVALRAIEQYLPPAPEEGVAEAGDVARGELAALVQVCADAMVAHEDANLKRQVEADAQAFVDDEALKADRYAFGLKEAEAEAQAAIAALEAALPEAPTADAVRDLEDALVGARDRVSRAQGQLHAAEDAATKARVEETAIHMLARGVDRWAYLQRALGRTGMQAAEIEAAGPRVSELAMQILEPFGGRFEVRIATTAPKARGKGEKDVCDLVVIDHESGHEGSADWLSDGQQGVVGEALALAVAAYNGERGGVRPFDIWRDEISGSLDEEWSRKYIELLHHATRVCGFGRVWFVAHQCELWSLADAAVNVRPGEVVVDA